MAGPHDQPATVVHLQRLTQPRISDLVRGKIHRFTVDGFVTMLYCADIGVSVTTHVRKGQTAVRAVRKARRERGITPYAKVRRKAKLA